MIDNRCSYRQNTKHKNGNISSINCVDVWVFFCYMPVLFCYMRVLFCYMCVLFCYMHVLFCYIHVLFCHKCVLFCYMHVLFCYMHVLYCYMHCYILLYVCFILLYAFCSVCIVYIHCFLVKDFHLLRKVDKIGLFVVYMFCSVICFILLCMHICVLYSVIRVFYSVICFILLFMHICVFYSVICIVFLWRTFIYCERLCAYIHICVFYSVKFMFYSVFAITPVCIVLLRKVDKIGLFVSDSFLSWKTISLKKCIPYIRTTI